MACRRVLGDGWRRRLRLHPVVLGLAAAALAAAVINLPAEHRDYVAARLLLDAVPHPPFHLPPVAANHPLVRTIDLGHGHAAFATTASLYLPARGNHLPGIVIAVGATPLGRQDPQAVQLARALARAGQAVLVPDLALRASTLDAADLHRIPAAFNALAALPRVDPRRIGLLGISWGGALIVIAASTPPLADKVAFVATFGAFYDLADLAGAVVTGATIYHGQVVRWHTVPEAQALVRSALLSRLTPGKASAVQAALADPRALPSLPPAERAVVELLTNQDPTRVAHLAARLPPSIQQVRQAFSPAFHIQGLRAPLLALHSTDDPAAPWTESALLVTAARAHDRGGARLTLVHVFSHVTQNGSLVAPSALLDDWRLIRYVAGL
ncbi:MAG TPA: CocE/NonD family hydrolase, partial [Streptosporangiaceae bacterium]